VRPKLRHGDWPKGSATRANLPRFKYGCVTGQSPGDLLAQRSRVATPLALLAVNRLVAGYLNTLKGYVPGTSGLPFTDAGGKKSGVVGWGRELSSLTLAEKPKTKQWACVDLLRRVCQIKYLKNMI